MLSLDGGPVLRVEPGLRVLVLLQVCPAQTELLGRHDKKERECKGSAYRKLGHLSSPWRYEQSFSVAIGVARACCCVVQSGSHRITEEAVVWVVHPLVCGEEQVVDHGAKVEATLTLVTKMYGAREINLHQKTRITREVGEVKRIFVPRRP